ncbi:MAG TPA: EI24 domain-containing protein [Natronosporangium sp.]
MGFVGRYLTGVRLLVRGLAMYARAPSVLLLGLVPVLIVAVVFIAILVVLLIFIEQIASGVTWWAADWSETPRTLVRLVAGFSVVGTALLLAMITFTQVTLAVGDPVYERISRRVEDWCGGAPAEVELGFWRSARHSLADSGKLVALTAATGIPLFVAGFIPVVGQTLVPVTAATVAGWLLALELVGAPFSARGLRLADRRRALRHHRPEALGFGTAVFLGFTFIPFGAILLMPAAVAGGTLLARKALGLPDQPAPRPPARPATPAPRPHG